MQRVGQAFRPVLQCTVPACNMDSSLTGAAAKSGVPADRDCSKSGVGERQTCQQGTQKVRQACSLSLQDKPRLLLTDGPAQGGMDAT